MYALRPGWPLARAPSICRRSVAYAASAWYCAERSWSVPSCLDAPVRLAEDAQSQHADEDEQRSDDEERDEQLRAHGRGRAGDDAHESMLDPCESRPPPRAGGASATSGCAIGPPGYGPSLGFDATEFTISHLPLIFCTSWSTPT